MSNNNVLKIKDELHYAKAKFSDATYLAGAMLEDNSRRALGEPAYSAKMSGIFAAAMYEAAGHLLVAQALLDRVDFE